MELIPSENFVSKAVMEAVGSCLMNKYAEGYPKKRYYQGNRNADEIESLCQKRALQAFGLSDKEWGVNVQPHSGCEANLAVYNALLQPGDKIMAMYLPDGGHLSHGWSLPNKKVTLVSKIWEVQFYHVNQKTEVFDYDQIEKQALKFRPKLIISGGTAYPRTINHKRMSQIAKKVRGYYLADIAHEAGLVVGGAHASPFPHADVVTFTTHKTLRGPRGAMIIGRIDLIDKINFSVFPGLQGGPHLHTIAGIAVALRETQSKPFKKYAWQVVKNAKVLALDLKKGGLKIVSGGTDKHLVLIDLRNKNLTGWVVAWALEKAGIIANRNTVPYDTGSAFYPSGLRLGTPALTSRGMKEEEMKQISQWILSVINYLKDKNLANDRDTLKKLSQDKFLQNLKAKVNALAKKYPLPGK